MPAIPQASSLSDVSPLILTAPATARHHRESERHRQPAQLVPEAAVRALPKCGRSRTAPSIARDDRPTPSEPDAEPHDAACVLPLRRNQLAVIVEHDNREGLQAKLTGFFDSNFDDLVRLLECNFRHGVSAR